MQDRMFNTADILVYRCPVIDGFLRKWKLVILRISVAQVVPGGAKESIHGISLTLSRFTANRANAIYKVFRGRKR